MYAFNPSTQQADLCEFEASLVYRASAKTAKVTQRDLVSAKKQMWMQKINIKNS